MGSKTFTVFLDSSVRSHLQKKSHEDLERLHDVLFSLTLSRSSKLFMNSWQLQQWRIQEAQQAPPPPPKIWSTVIFL